MANAVGGQEQSVFYPIDSAHTTITATAALTLDEDTVTTDIQKDAVVYDTIKFDPTLVDFIQDSVLVGGGETSPEEVVTEKGTKKSTATSTSADQFIDIIYGAVVDVAGTDKQVVTVALGTVSGDSEAFKQEYNKYSRVPFKLDLVAAKVDVTIDNARLDATLINITGLTPIVLPEGRKKKIFFLPVP